MSLKYMDAFGATPTNLGMAFTRATARSRRCSVKSRSSPSFVNVESARSGVLGGALDSCLFCLLCLLTCPQSRFAFSTSFSLEGPGSRISECGCEICVGLRLGSLESSCEMAPSTAPILGRIPAFAMTCIKCTVSPRSSIGVSPGGPGDADEPIREPAIAPVMAASAVSNRMRSALNFGGVLAIEAPPRREAPGSTSPNLCSNME
mmetsp:Transcript_20719/g.39384  ORF Transcript_20719/g.39384 Transcript_20719/m.39384 type:complete len:205 (+) Transcript_20719:448-1062(+)